MSDGLVIQDVVKRFGDVAAVDGVSLQFRQGEFVTIVGPSGCGKTTLLRIIAGLEAADAGSVRLGGLCLDPLPANRRPVNTVFQNYALFPHMTVYDNVAFGLRARRRHAAEVAGKVDDGLRLLQLEPLAGRYPNQLSGGQKQRVALARALVNEPEVLLLDEPMSALDAKLRAEVQMELRRLQRRIGKTFVLVTHDQDEAMTVSDRIVVMNRGRIEQEGPTAEVYQRPRTRFVAGFFGAANVIEAEAAGPGRVCTPVGELIVTAALLWTRGAVSIHPEWIEVRAERPAVNGVLATVKERVFRGDSVELLVEPGPLKVQVGPGAPHVLGDRVWLELPPERLEVLIG